MIDAILSLSTSTQSAHRAAVRAGDVDLAAELRKLGFEVAMAMAARRAA